MFSFKKFLKESDKLGKLMNSLKNDPHPITPENSRPVAKILDSMKPHRVVSTDDMIDLAKKIKEQQPKKLSIRVKTGKERLGQFGDHPVLIKKGYELRRQGHHDYDIALHLFGDHTKGRKFGRAMDSPKNRARFKDEYHKPREYFDSLPPEHEDSLIYKHGKEIENKGTIGIPDNELKMIYDMRKSMRYTAENIANKMGYSDGDIKKDADHPANKKKFGKDWYPHITQKMSMTPETIKRGYQFRKQGMSDHSIARKLKIGPETVSRTLDHTYIKRAYADHYVPENKRDTISNWTDDHIRKVFELRKKGIYSKANIAASMKVSPKNLTSLVDSDETKKRFGNEYVPHGFSPEREKELNNIRRKFMIGLFKNKR